mmetsp:Transcript_12503/g.38731  ORF Transcript_12503/g.38731 Transcript_12503/m.38731 type:complete len:304 (-) Transcript_12503:124-1035(-)
MQDGLLERGLSLVPEVATLRCRFCFAFIGPNASNLIDDVVRAADEAEVAQVVKLFDAKAKQDAFGSSRSGSAGSSVLGSESQPVYSSELEDPPQWQAGAKGKGQTASPKDRGIYVLLDEDDLSIARVKLSAVQNFNDVLGDTGVLECGFKGACFVFLMDLRLDVMQDVLPVLGQGLAEMTFLQCQSKPKVGRDKVRALLLTHEEGATGQWPVFPEDVPEEPSEVTSFVDKLVNVSTALRPRRPHRPVDFERGDLLFQFIQRLARDMSKASRSSVAMSRIFSGVSSSFVSARDNAKRSQCCSVQ